MIIETAQARRFTGTIEAPTTAPDTEERAVRQADRNGLHQEFVAVGNGREKLPRMNTAISPSSSRFRPVRAPTAAITGAPTTTRSRTRDDVPGGRDGDADASAICGSRPIVTNSVVPIAKPPIASASRARPTCRLVSGVTELVTLIAHPPSLAKRRLSR